MPCRILEIGAFSKMGGGPSLGGPHRKDSSILGSILGSLLGSYHWVCVKFLFWQVEQIVWLCVALLLACLRFLRSGLHTARLSQTNAFPGEFAE